jgi:tetratricopeptide (TPR) repeat protein
MYREGLLPRGIRVWLLVCSSLTAWSACAQAQDIASRAAAARDANQIAAAVRLYRQGVQEKPGWLEGWWFLGLLAYQSGQFADGRQAFTEFTKRNAKAPAGWAFLGLCEYETGEYDSALEHLERGFASGARLDPEVEQVARFHRALLLTRAGSFDRAREELKPFAERGIRDPVLIAGLGLNALEMPALPQQVPAAQRDLVEMAGKTAYTWIAGDTSQTEAGFRSLLGAYPRAAGVHYLYATYLLDVRPQAMNSELRRELQVNPGNARARAALALRLRLAGDAAAALPLARKAAEDSPRLALAQYAYGVVLTETGAASDAIGHLQAAVRIDPGNLGYHTALATAYSEAGRYQDAYRERQASIKLARESGAPG